MERKWEAKLVLNHAKVVQHLQRVSVRVNAWLRRRSNGERVFMQTFMQSVKELLQALAKRCAKLAQKVRQQLKHLRKQLRQLRRK
jgi:hypothetical protein